MISELLRELAAAAGKPASPGRDVEGFSLAIHRLWQRVCGFPGEDDAGARSLEQLAGSFEISAGLFPPDSIASALGKLGGGMAMLRANRHEDAIAAFDSTKAFAATDPLFFSTACCWKSMAFSFFGKCQEAKVCIVEAQARIVNLTEGRRGFNALIGLCEALLSHQLGNYQEAAVAAANVQRWANSPHAERILWYPCCLAEAELVRAKALRELDCYGPAFDAADESQRLRRRDDVNDRLGQAWCCIEKARIHRFRSQFDAAHRELDEAERLLRGADFPYWSAQIEDQRGDVYRLDERRKDRLSDAQACYERAEQFAINLKNVRLQGHVANSFARLYEAQGQADKALDCLEPHKETWVDTKDYGKYLFLKGSIYATFHDRRLAIKTLQKAIGELDRFKNRGYEALAQDRLAHVLLDDEKKQEACAAWGRALRLARDLEVKPMLDGLQKRVEELGAEEAVQIAAGLVAEKQAWHKKNGELEQKILEAKARGQVERWHVGHWFARPVGMRLWKTGESLPVLPAFLQDFGHLLQGHDWSHNDYLSFEPARPEVSNVWPSVQTACESVSARMKTPIRIDPPSPPLIVGVNHAFFTVAVEALLRGAYSAFGTRHFQLGGDVAEADPEDYRLEFRFLDTPAEVFRNAQDLAQLDAVWTEPALVEFFQRGYTGDFSLLQFVIGVWLWGRVDYHTETTTVVIRSAKREKKESAT